MENLGTWYMVAIIIFQRYEVDIWGLVARPERGSERFPGSTQPRSWAPVVPQSHPSRNQALPCYPQVLTTITMASELGKALFSCSRSCVPGNSGCTSGPLKCCYVVALKAILSFRLLVRLWVRWALVGQPRCRVNTYNIVSMGKLSSKFQLNTLFICWRLPVLYEN